MENLHAVWQALLNNREFLLNVGRWIILTGAFLWALHQIDGTLSRSWKMVRRIFLLPRILRGRRMVARARKIGTLLIYNTENRITGVCSSRRFNNRFNDTGSLVYQLSTLEKGSSEWKAAMTMKANVKPCSIYTFAEDEGLQRGMHTGYRHQSELAMELLILAWTGYSKKQVFKDDYERALRILVRQDRRLVVPFIDAKNPGDEDLALYGELTLDGMMEDFRGLADPSK